MKIIDKKCGFFLSLLLLITSVKAEINSVNGPYVGAEIGPVFNNTPPGTAFNTAIGIHGYLQPYIGYRVNDFFAAEVGYYGFKNDSNNGGRVSSFGGVYGPDHLKLNAASLTGKAIYPFMNGLSMFGKAGLAVTHQDVYNQVFIGNPPMVDSNEIRVLPLIGAGVSYNFTKHFAMDLSGTHIQGSGIINNIELLGVGLSYTFN